MVQPDISVICDKKRLDNRRYRGAPELVIEIVSPSTGDRDRILKRKLYEKHGVKEYWLVDYQDKKVEVYLNNDRVKIQKGCGKGENRFREPFLYNERDTAAVNIFDDFSINLADVFRGLE